MQAEIGDVAATAFLTLCCHALESRSVNPILSDPKSVEIAARLNTMPATSGGGADRMPASCSVPESLVVHIAIRAKKYDEYTGDFLQRFPDSAVINIGCGLDSRFLRMDNGRAAFYDLDLPEIIRLRKEFFTETDRYHLIASSVMDFSWMDAVRQHRGPFLFMAEGVFMYLDGNDVRSLVMKLRETFPGSELVCEVFNSLWLRFPWKVFTDYKLQKQLRLGKDAMFRSGIRDSREMEQWHAGIRFLDDWCYFDADEPKLGWLRLMRHLWFMRKTQWTVHYLLG